MISKEFIIIICSVLAGFSVLSVIMGYLKKAEKRDRFKNLIQDRRKNLYEDAIESTKKKEKVVTSKENVATFFKVEQKVGKAAVNIRKKMVTAGYRSAGAPLTFMTIKLVLPILFSVLAFFYSRGLDDTDSFTLMAIILGAAAAGFYLPDILLKNQITKRQEEIGLVFPDALDMILICVQGGISIEQAIDRISIEIANQSQTLAEELGLLSAEMGLLSDKAQAYLDFADRVGSGAANSFANAMIQSEKYGTSVSQAIRVMADELRGERMSVAEEKAASLPPKLTVPMILFFLPPLFCFILGPAVIQVMGLEGP